MIQARADPAPYGHLRRIFRDRTGHELEGLWRAPGRVNLIGEHTDYNEGFVMPIALDRQTVVAGGARPDDVLRVWSLQQGDEPAFARPSELAPGSVSGWAAYVAGTAWAVAQIAGPLGGADLVIDSDVPVGAGLSSSAALEIATGLAMSHLSGVDIDLEDLALAAQRAENDFVGVPCGIMDQMVSSSARGGHALLIDTRTLHARHVPFDPDPLGAALVVVDTRTSHRLADGEYAARRRGCEEAARILGVAALRDIAPGDLEDVLDRLPESHAPLVRHVVTENQRVLRTASALEHGDLHKAGREMSDSHASLRDDFRVSSAELDLAVDVARKTRAFGARMTGAGFGGSAIALVRRDDAGSLEREIAKAFAERGLVEPEFFRVAAAPGCSRIWP